MAYANQEEILRTASRLSNAANYLDKAEQSDVVFACVLKPNEGMTTTSDNAIFFVHNKNKHNIKTDETEYFDIYVRIGHIDSMNRSSVCAGDEKIIKENLVYKEKLIEKLSKEMTKSCQNSGFAAVPKGELLTSITVEKIRSFKLHKRSGYDFCQQLARAMFGELVETKKCFYNFCYDFYFGKDMQWFNLL